jgi:site-specific recombinase
MGLLLFAKGVSLPPILYLLLNTEASDEVWFEGLLRWLVEGSPRAGDHSQRTARLATLNTALQDHPQGPDWRARIRKVWGHTSAVRLLADTGLSSHTAFLRELMHRVVERFVPRLDPEADLSALLDRLELSEDDADWIQNLAQDQARPWRELLVLPREAVWDAAQLLAYRATALGLARDLLGLGPDERELDSPFGRLPETMAALRRGEDTDWPELLAACRIRLQAALDYLDSHGVSSELVFRLDLLEAHLQRMEELVSLAAGSLDGQAFAATLIRRSTSRRSFRSLLRSTTRRLARKVVEHTGQTGEHYIANSREEWVGTFWSAAWGGVLTAFTAALKYAIALAALAPMVAGLGYAANYTVSFVTMQFAGFTLASKQPAMTAASLAAALEDRLPGKAMVDLVAGISRSQCMATVGNVLWTMPAAILLSLAWQKVTGAPILSPETAAHSLQSLHPWRSWTLPFAALTGVFLWMSSLAAGWAANWSAFRRLPEALSGHRRLVYWLGPERAAAVGRFVGRNLGGVCGYIALGFLLGFMPVVFTFMGIHAEVRHVTLSAASLALCAASELTGKAAMPWAGLAWGMAGIAGIGILNFGVSFALALRTAIDARGLDRKGREGLRRLLWTAFRSNPWHFIGPPAGKGGGEMPR